MLTSESSSLEFIRFFSQHQFELFARSHSLIEKKYRRSIIQANKRGEEYPPVINYLKIGEITLYNCVFGVKLKGNKFDCNDITRYLIMKDLRKQTKILVVVLEHDTFIFTTHAVSRYKERLGLDDEMNFEDVCKHMITQGHCDLSVILKGLEDIYGTNENHMEVHFVCLKGAFLGYYSKETNVYYADTFLSPNEMGEEQTFLDVNKEPLWRKWKELSSKNDRKAIIEERDKFFLPKTNSDNEGSDLLVLHGDQAKERLEEMYRSHEENPDYKEKMIETNRQKTEKRLKRKGIL